MVNINGSDQHSLGWFRDRLGFITGSEVGKIMVSGRKKDELFGETAKSYLYEIAYERDLNPKIIEDDMMFQYYLDTVTVSSKAMSFGTEHEGDARLLYQKLEDCKVQECPSVRHPTIPYFSSSPDGYIDKGEIKGCLEIKCLGKANFGKYKRLVKTPEDLKAVNSQYYWQCQAHLSVTGADYCDFFAYNPFVIHPYIHIHIYRDDAVIEELENRVKLANQFIDNNE